MANDLINSREVIKTQHQTYYISVSSNCPSGQIILCLHGGPGLPDAELIRRYNSALAENATLVTWDQRGAGEAYSAAFAFKKNLMKARVLDDINNVVDYLRKRFHQEKVVLLAHGFGAVLSVWYAQQHPDKVQCLLAVNPSVTEVETFTLSSDTVLPVIPAFLRNRGASGAVKYFIGAKWSSNSPLAKEEFDLRQFAAQLSVPVFGFIGAEQPEAAEWLQLLQAPQKEIYSFDCDGNPLFEEADKVNEIIQQITEQ